MAGIITRAIAWLDAIEAARYAKPVITKSEPPLAPIESETYLDAYGVNDAPTQGQLIKSYRGTAYACANLCAQAVAATPLRLYVTTGRGQAKPRVETRAVSRKTMQWLSQNPSCTKQVAGATDVEEVLEHPILELLQNVNRELDGFSLMEITDLYMEVVGSAYWYLPRDPLGNIEAIWILQSQFVTPVYDKAGKLKEYKYGSEDKAKRFSKDDILPFYLPSLGNLYNDGYSPLRAAYESVLMEENGKAHAAALQKNNARPDMLVWATGEGGGLGEDESKRLERRFNRKFREGGTGGIMVVGDEVDIRPLNFPPKDVQFALMANLNKEDIANAYGVPMSLLQTKDVNRANAEAGHYQLAKNAVLPRCRRLDQRLTQRFAVLFDPRLILIFDDPVPEDREFMLKKRQADLGMGVLVINEARAEDGREPVEGGDIPLVPSSMSTLESIVDPPDPPPQLMPGAPPAAPDEEPDEEEDKPAPKSVAHGPRDKVGRKHNRRLPKGRALAETLQGQFRKQQTVIMKRFKAITKESWRPPDGIFDGAPWSEFDISMANASRGHLTVTATEGVDVVKSDLQRRFPGEFDSWSVPPVKLQEAMAQASMDFSVSTNNTTRLALNDALGKLRTELAEGIITEGNTVSALTARVKGVFEDAETYRAQRIAVTESNRAIHQGERLAAQESVYVKGFRWLLSDDACEKCKAVAAKMPEVDLTSPFTVDDKGGPYAEIYHPPLHPNCQCSMMEVFNWEDGVPESEKPKEPKDVRGIPTKANGKKLTQEDKELINSYTDANYLNIVPAQRGVAMPESAWLTRAEALKEAKQLESALLKLPGIKGEAFRGMAFKSAKDKAAFLKKFKPGGVWKADSFQSASQSMSVTDEFIRAKRHPVLVEIQGKTGRNVMKWSENQWEEEVLFMKGSQFKILSVIDDVIKLVEV